MPQRIAPLATLLAGIGLCLGATAAAQDSAAGGSSRTFVYVSGGAPEITCFSRDPVTGALAPSSVSPGGRNPGFLAWTPDHRHLYAINEGAPGTPGSRVRSYAISPTDGALTLQGEIASGGRGACHVAVHPEGRWVYIAHYSSGHLSVLPIQADGSLGEPLEVIEPGVKAHMALTDRAGRFLFVPCLGSDHIAIYRIDAATGHLTPHDPATVALPAGAGPRHLAFHPSEKMAYVLNELASTLTSFTYDAGSGRFADPVTIPTLPPEFSGKNTTAHVRVSPDGRTLYGSNRGHDSVAIFPVDPATLRPQAPTWETGGGDIRRPRHFTVDDAGAFAYVANQDGNSLTAFTVSPATGAWTKVVTLPVSKSPTYVGVMPAP